LGIVAIGIAFFMTSKGYQFCIYVLLTCTGMLGLARQSDEIIGNAFDILSLEALFLVPR
jgi:hypothetical protein